MILFVCMCDIMAWFKARIGRLQKETLAALHKPRWKGGVSSARRDRD
jgi:hypothetical protein